MYLSIVSSLASCIVGAVVENRPGKVGVEVPMAMTAAGEGEKEAATGVAKSGQRAAVKRREEEEGVKSKNRVFSGL